MLLLSAGTKIMLKDSGEKECENDLKSKDDETVADRDETKKSLEVDTSKNVDVTVSGDSNVQFSPSSPVPSIASSITSVYSDMSDPSAASEDEISD